MADTNRQPIRWVRDNIAVTRGGIPYGIWALDGKPYGMATVADKEQVRASHQELFQSVTGESTILGLVATTPPQQIIDQMLKDVEEPTREWLIECDLTYEALLSLPAGERAYFFIAPLVSYSPKEFWERGKDQAVKLVTNFLGLPENPPSEEIFRSWKTRAQMIEGKIPKAFKPKPAGILALRWITSHLSSRGAQASETYAFKPITDGSQWINANGCIPEPMIDEGDMESIAHEKTAKAKLFKRRFVKVSRNDTDPSYQQFGCLAMTPQAGFVFPGSEFVNHAAGLVEDIDFCIRINSIPAAKAKDRNAKAERNLADQYQQRAGTQGITGGNSEMDKSAQSLMDYVAALNASDREVEVNATIIFAASGPSAERAEADMKELTTFYKSEDWLIDVPFGAQERLFWDFWPASTTSQVASEYTQVTTGYNFSMGIPLTNDSLGMPQGFRVGINITTGRHSTVLMDLAGLAENDVSGAFAAIGELGSGKSVILKTIASMAIDRRAKLVAVDHSDNQEWAALARSLTTANVIDFLEPEYSLDPLRIWESKSERKRQSLSLITMMLGIDSDNAEYGLIDEVLDTLLKREENVNMHELHMFMENGEFAERDKDMAVGLARRLNIFSKLDYASAFFDTSLPPMDFGYQATVFCTHGLSLPSERELFGEGKGAKLDITKRMGRAIYAYLAEVGKKIAYSDDSQEVLFLVDEAHHMTRSPEGSETIKTMIKTGRKHKAAVGLGTHSADELGDDDLRALIPQRFCFRTRDKDLAVKNLQWLDKSYATDEYVEALTRNTAPMDSEGKVPMERRGECFYRDPLNRIGKIKVEIPRNPDRAKTVLTSPPKIQRKEEATV